MPIAKLYNNRRAAASCLEGSPGHGLHVVTMPLLSDKVVSMCVAMIQPHSQALHQSPAALHQSPEALLQQTPLSNYMYIYISILEAPRCLEGSPGHGLHVATMPLASGKVVSMCIKMPCILGHILTHAFLLGLPLCVRLQRTRLPSVTRLALQLHHRDGWPF